MLFLRYFSLKGICCDLQFIDLNVAELTDIENQSMVILPEKNAVVVSL